MHLTESARRMEGSGKILFNSRSSLGMTAKGASTPRFPEPGATDFQNGPTLPDRRA